MVTHRSVRASFALVGLTAFLLVFGSTVRVHGAGLSCPDWPLCFGVLVPELDFKVSLEWGHRVVASFVSAGFLAMGAWAVAVGVWRRSASFRVLYGIAALALVAQVILGGLTVLELLAEWTVASHLVTGNTFCALLLALALTLRSLAVSDSVDHAGADPGVGEGAASTTLAMRALSALLLVAVPAQLVLGGLVAGSHAGLACGTWPGCNGPDWFPTFAGLVGLQVTHRVMAYTLLAIGLANAWAQWAGPARRPSLVVLAALCVQATLGVLNVLWQMPVEITLLHSAGAATVYLTSTWNAFNVWSRPLLVGAPSARPRLITVEAK